MRLAWAKSGGEARDKGTVTVEFALVFWLFIVFLAGIIEFGHLWYVKHLVTRASREGARWAVVYRIDNNGNRFIPPDTDIKQYLQDRILGQGFMNHYDVDVKRFLSPQGDDLSVSVVARQNVTFILDDLLKLFNNNFQGISQVGATTTMKLE
jgi:hypothetical protein